MNRWLTEEEFKIAADNGIDENTLRSRVYAYGWDVETAITKPKRKYSREGKLSKELFEKAEKNGIGRRTLEKRVYDYKWNVQRAITQPVRRFSN